MITADLRLIETGDGGDYVLKGNDVELISGFQNMPYIGLFGGNEQSTTGPKNTEQTFDFWGNFLHHPTQPEIWINSITESILKKVPLNSFGRIQIEQAVIKDLGFMKEFSLINVSVSIIAIDRIRILIEIQEPNALNSTVFTYIWNATEQELEQEPGTPTPGTQYGNGVALNFPLNFGL